MSTPPVINRASKRNSIDLSFSNSNTSNPTANYHSSTTTAGPINNIPIAARRTSSSGESIDTPRSSTNNPLNSQPTTPSNTRISNNTNNHNSNAAVSNLLAKYELTRNDPTNLHKYISSSNNSPRTSITASTNHTVRLLHERIAELEAENIELKQRLQLMDDEKQLPHNDNHPSSTVEPSIDSSMNTPVDSSTHSTNANNSIDPATIILLQYQNDSPYTRKEHDDMLHRIQLLDTKLSNITHRAAEYQRTLDQLSSHAEYLCNEFSDIATYTYCETGVKSDIQPELDELQHNTILCNSMINLGVMFETIHNVTSNMKLNVDTFLIYCLNDIRNTYIKQLIDTSHVVTQLADQHELSVHKLLSQRATMNTDGTIQYTNDMKSQINNAFDRLKSRMHDTVQHNNKQGRSVSIDSQSSPSMDLGVLQQLVNSTRLQYDSARYDYIVQLNQCMTVNKLELAQYINATVQAFYTYFKDGTTQTNILKRNGDIINNYITRYKPVYTQLIQSQINSRNDLLNNITTNSTLSHHRASSVTHSTPSTRINKEHERSGYLRKQSSNVRKDWKRRWFILKSGQLYYVRSSTDLNPIHVVNAIICHVRGSKLSDLPYTFDLISPTKRTYTLQAESYADYCDWLDVLHNATEHEMNDSTAMINNSTTLINQQRSAVLSAIDKLKQINQSCADCANSTELPDWAVINFGICICIDCIGIHRSLGTHISKTRSLSLDSWSTSLIEMMLAVGNKRFNALYEAELFANNSICDKPDTNSTTQHKTEYIQYKYIKRIYFNKSALADIAGTYTQMYHKLFIAAQKGDVRVCMICHALNIDFNLTESMAQKLDTIKGTSNINDITAVLNDTNVADADSSSTSSTSITGTTALHIAAEYDQLIVLEYMIQNNGRVDILNDYGLSVWDVAHRHNSTKVLDRVSKNKL